MPKKTIVVASCLILVLISGCVSQEKYRKLEMENSRIETQMKQDQKALFNLQIQNMELFQNAKLLNENKKLRKEIDELKLQLKNGKSADHQTEKIISRSTPATNEKSADQQTEKIISGSNEVLSRGLQIISNEGRPPKPTGPERLSLYIYFDFDSADLKFQGRAQLSELANTMQSPGNGDRIFKIEGHSDTAGPDEYNLDLSLRRAEAVRQFLVSEGIEFDRLEVAGLGESRPLVPEGDTEKQAANRRVEFLRMGRFEK